MWGGYNALFKVIPKDLYRDLGGVPGMTPSGSALERMRREAQVTGPKFERVFIIEISKFEYIEGRMIANVDDYDCYVYTPAMIAAEKFRAICQQSPLYGKRKNPAPRPRDYFDIHTIATLAGCDIADHANHTLVENMFAVKDVPLSLLSEIGTDESRAFHAQQWPSVADAVRGGVSEPFDYYFDFVTRESQRLMAALGL